MNLREYFSSSPGRTHFSGDPCYLWDAEQVPISVVLPVIEWFNALDDEWSQIFVNGGMSDSGDVTYSIRLEFERNEGDDAFRRFLDAQDTR